MSHRRDRKGSPANKLRRAVAVLALVGSFVVGAQEASALTSAAIPPATSAADRAEALGLPAPDAVRQSSSSACAEDVVTGELDCFDTLAQLATFVSGDQSLTTAGTSLTTSSDSLAQTDGFGGTQVGTSGYTALGLTCYDSGCTVNAVVWWTQSSGYQNCTHAYPANDYYKNSAPTYRVYSPVDAGTLNCNRMVAYPGSAQQGTGAQNCYLSLNPSGCTWSTSMNSISWSNS